MSNNDKENDSNAEEKELNKNQSKQTEAAEEIKDEQENDLEQPEIEHKMSAVASMPAKNMAVIGIFILAILFMVYFLFFSGEEEPVKSQPKLSQTTQAVKPPEELDNPLPSIDREIRDPFIDGAVANAPTINIAPPESPRVTPLPVVEDETPTITPVPLPSIVADKPTITAPKKPQNYEQRLKSSMLVFGSNNQNKSAEDEKRLRDQIIDSDYMPVRTSAEQAIATRIGDLKSTIAQGKIIDAVLESAVNTDFPGYIRAIVSRDVYAESGNRVMIPKGSRLVGVYSAEINRTQKRVMIAWNRLIRPDGVDVMIDSPGIDQIGRAGTEGVVDPKFFEIFANALLMSSITYAITYQAERSRGTKGAQGNTSTSNTVNPLSGAVTTTTTEPNKSATDKAFDDSIKGVQDAAKKIADNFLDERPTITIDQGTRLKVFVKKDLIFPKSFSGGTTILH